MGEWTGEVEDILEKLRINCVNLSEYHRKRYYHFKAYGKWFRLPLIILASINSTASVGLQPLMEQQIISGITCLIGMFMGIISAYELYLGIQGNMELELKQSKDFYTLSIDLFKTLSLRRENRGEDGKDYLNKKYSHYIKLTEASNLLKRKLVIDTLTTIPNEMVDETPKGSDTEEIQLGSLYTAPRPSYSQDDLKEISQHITNELVEITEETSLVEPKENIEEI